MTKPPPAAEHPRLRLLGEVIHMRRRRLRMSQEALAEKSGLYRTHISRIERGEANVSLLNLLTVAEALGMTAAELLAEASL